MGRRMWPTAPLELISLDFLVDLPRTTKGNAYLLVTNNHFTKLIKLYAIKDRKLRLQVLVFTIVFLHMHVVFH